MEIVRGAILALPKGQWEAAAALGRSRRYAFRDVVIPQVFRVVLPAFGNSSFLVVSASFVLVAAGRTLRLGWMGHRDVGHLRGLSPRRCPPYLPCRIGSLPKRDDDLDPLVHQ
ncbi:ABC transporter permease subunit (plasmid) [Cupriavidus basilensis]